MGRIKLYCACNSADQTMLLFVFFAPQSSRKTRKNVANGNTRNISPQPNNSTAEATMTAALQKAALKVPNRDFACTGKCPSSTCVHPNS